MTPSEKLPKTQKENKDKRENSVLRLTPGGTFFFLDHLLRTLKINQGLDLRQACRAFLTGLLRVGNYETVEKHLPGLAVMGTSSLHDFECRGGLDTRHEQVEGLKDWVHRRQVYLLEVWREQDLLKHRRC